MKIITPIWLNNFSVPIEGSGKRNDKVEGDSIPNKEGPRRIPATISPTTAGCPTFRKSLPNSLAAITMTMICSSKMLRVDRVLLCRVLPICVTAVSNWEGSEVTRFIVELSTRLSTVLWLLSRREPYSRISVIPDPKSDSVTT
jgi:hypothetical protein